MAVNTFCILFFIKKNETKKSGLSTIMVRLTINGQQVQFSSGLSVDPLLWDQKTKQAVENSVDSVYCKDINKKLKAIKTNIEDHYTRLSQSLDYVSVHRLKQSFLAVEEETLLTYQFKEQVKIYRSKSGRNICSATADMYKLTLERLIEFMKLTYKVPDIHIYQIDLWFLERFYQFLHKKYKCSTNTTIKYMKRFASIMNFAQKTGLIQVNPFNIFRFHTEKKEPVYLTEEELRRIMDKEFVTERLAVVRDAFVFSCYTGLSFSDIANLKFSDIQERNSLYRIRTGRRKTDSVSYIPLLDIPMRILDRYRGKYKIKHKEKEKYRVQHNIQYKELNIEETDDKGIRDISNTGDNKVFPIRSNQVTNEFLKEIADVCGIGKKVSYHVARHTFATLALSNGVSLESVSKMMGHTSIRTTQVYAQITNLKVKEEMEVMADRLKAKK